MIRKLTLFNESPVISPSEMKFRIECDHYRFLKMNIYEYNNDFRIVTKNIQEPGWEKVRSNQNKLSISIHGKNCSRLSILFTCLNKLLFNCKKLIYAVNRCGLSGVPKLGITESIPIEILQQKLSTTPPSFPYIIT